MREMVGGEWGYVVVWEFKVRAQAESRFEKAYGADGEWARLFRQDNSYFGTELIRDVKVGRQYVTLDFWRSKLAYDKFREEHRSEYKAIDAKCEELTEMEREIGSYERPGK